jgi:hypothetical protein
MAADHTELNRLPEHRPEVAERLPLQWEAVAERCGVPPGPPAGRSRCRHFALGQPYGGKGVLPRATSMNLTLENRIPEQSPFLEQAWHIG